MTTNISSSDSFENLCKSSVESDSAMRAECDALVKHGDELIALVKVHPYLQSTDIGQALIRLEASRNTKADAPVPQAKKQ